MGLWQMKWRWAAVLCGLLLVMLCACAGREAQMAASAGDAEHDHESSQDGELPEVEPVSLDHGEKLNVVATTSIVADVVGQVGGDQIDLTSLMLPGADPHSYTPTPQDMRMLNQTHVIFINGLQLEESLSPVLENLDTDVLVASVNAGVETLAVDGDHEGAAHEEDGQIGADPHTWMDVRNVERWVENVAHLLGDLDPDHAAAYAANAEAYLAELAMLDTEIQDAVDAIPPAKRKLVTDHDSFSYFADRYGLVLVGTVIPAVSTLAAPSAQELAALQEQIEQEGVVAIFVGSTVNPELAEQIGHDLQIQVVPLYTGSLSDASGPASSYIAMMRYNLNGIIKALK